MKPHAITNNSSSGIQNRNTGCRPMLSLVGEPSTGPHASPSVNNDRGRTEAVRERPKSSCSFSRPGATMAAAQVLDSLVSHYLDITPCQGTYLKNEKPATMKTVVTFRHGCQFLALRFSFLCCATITSTGVVWGRRWLNARKGSHTSQDVFRSTGSLGPIITVVVTAILPVR